MIETQSNLFPYKIGLIHFVGIGGIGMSGIALVLHSMNQKVQGSDSNDSYMVKTLENKGIKVFRGHHGSHLENVKLVVKSSSIEDNNVEIIEAKRLKIPIIKRSQMLAQIMYSKHCIAISGTHGKTTTTSLVAKILEDTFHPSVINGGIINELSSNVLIGKGDLLVAEADESDGTFIDIPAFASVITNIDPEHLEYYGDFESIKQAYSTFITQTPFFGFSVTCFDNEVIRNIANKIKQKIIISYSIEYKLVDIQAYNIRTSREGTRFDVKLSQDLQDSLDLSYSDIKDISLSLHGNHNVLNALAACAVALKLNVSIDIIKNSLANFQGVKRRFTKVDEIRGITIIDDYAHHPKEILATLKSAKNLYTDLDNRIIAVMQPHRYSRLKNLFNEFSDCFKDADLVYITDVYSAGEKMIEDIDSKKLVNTIKKNNTSSVFLLQDHEKIVNILKGIVKPNDVIIFLGAGDITRYAYELAKELRLCKCDNP